MHRIVIPAVALGMTLGIIACQNEPTEQPYAQQQAQGLPADHPSAAAGEPAPSIPLPPPTSGGNAAAGIQWAPPAAWQVQGKKPMRVATYTVPPAGGGEAGELAVYFFGAGQGGGVDANIERWVGMVQQPDGKPSASVAQRSELTVEGLAITKVDVAGTYLFSTSPMSPNKIPKPGYRLLGAVVQAPQGNVFFKLTAPSATAEAAGFDNFLQTIRKI